MAGTFINDPALVGPVTGLIAAINAIAEMLIAAKIIEPATLATMLEAKIEEFRQVEDATLHDAANVLLLIRAPLVDQDRADQRRFLSDPPQGEA
jgi:hypothetical protein